jgi:hypothetical protein
MVPLIVLPLVVDLSPAVEGAFLAVDYLIWAVFAAWIGRCMTAGRQSERIARAGDRNEVGIARTPGNSGGHVAKHPDRV